MGRRAWRAVSERELDGNDWRRLFSHREPTFPMVSSTDTNAWQHGEIAVRTQFRPLTSGEAPTVQVELQIAPALVSPRYWIPTSPRA